MPRVPYLYLQPSGNVTGAQIAQGRGWQAPILEHCHPVFVKFMASFLQKYTTLYFAKVLIADNKTVRDLPEVGGNLQKKRDMCVHHILAKCMNPNCAFYNSQSKETDAQYDATICAVLAPVMVTFGDMGRQTYRCCL